MNPELVTVRCEHCASTIRLDRKRIGSRGKCPGCGQVTLLNSASPPFSQKETVAATSSEVETSFDSSQDPASDKSRVNANSKTSVSTQSARQLGRFRLDRQLGRGGFGEVWEAYDLNVGRKVAIKLPIFPLQDKKRSQRFLTEAQAAARLGHPNIVSVYDAGVLNAQHYLAIEFVAGKSLDQVQAEKPIAVADAAKLVLELASALAYAHDQSIIHRDIKPQNIVVAPDGTPKIVDFGLAKLIEQDSSQTVDGTIMGTPAYMAPEQARGEIQKLGPHTDQYSLGSVLYWLLTKQAPFVGPRIAIITQVISSEPVKPTSLAEGIDSRIEAICLKAMSKHPKDRYPSCHELAEDLQRYLNDEDIKAKPLSRWNRMLRLVQRNPREAMLSSAALLIFLAMLALSISGLARSMVLAESASQAKLVAETELAKQQLLEAELEKKLSEVETAKGSAIAAKERAELKKMEVIAASEGVDLLQKNNVSLDQEQAKRLKDLSDAERNAEQERLKAALAAREARRPEFINDPESKLEGIEKWINERQWSKAEEDLSLIPITHRRLRWKLQSHFVKRKLVELLFTHGQDSRFSIWDISSFEWNASNQRHNFLSLSRKNESIELREKDTLNLIETIPSGVFRFGQDDFIFNKDKKIVQGRSKCFRSSAQPVAGSLLAPDAVLIRDEDLKITIGIGLIEEDKNTQNSVLRIEKFSDLTWTRLTEMELEGKGWTSSWLASKGSDHAFELRQNKKKSAGTKPMFAIINDIASDTPNISIVKEPSNLPIFASQSLLESKRKIELDDSLEFVVAGSEQPKPKDGKKKWTLVMKTTSKNLLREIPVGGVSTEGRKGSDAPRLVFGDNNQVYFVYENKIAVCELQFDIAIGL